PVEGPEIGPHRVEGAGELVEDLAGRVGVAGEAREGLVEFRFQVVDRIKESVALGEESIDLVVEGSDVAPAVEAELLERSDLVFNLLDLVIDRLGPLNDRVRLLGVAGPLRPGGHGNVRRIGHRDLGAGRVGTEEETEPQQDEWKELSDHWISFS